jgi:beta-lactamase regulating signal transducer with metallopeptidase domain/uncharacterized GH25 family protein
MSSASILANLVMERLSAGGLEIAMKSTILIGGATVAYAALRRYTLVCSAMWNACLVALVLLPAAVFVAPGIDLPVSWWAVRTSDQAPQAFAAAEPIHGDASAALPAGPTAALRYEQAMSRPDLGSTESAQTIAAATSQSATSSGGRSTAAAPITAEGGSTFDWRMWLVIAYAAGAALMGLRLLLNLLAVRRLRACATAIDDDGWHGRLVHWSAALGVRRRVVLLGSDSVAVPVVVGAVRPAIIVPQQLVGQLSGQRRDAVWIHELAHVRRSDYGWQLLLSVVQLVYWPQPLVWLAGRSIARLRERACDDVCIYVLGSREEYRATLVDLARALVRPRALSLGMAAVRSSKIARRVAAIDRSTGNRHCLAGRRASWSLVLSVGVLTVLMGAMHPSVATSAVGETEAAQAPASGEAQKSEQSVKAPPIADKSEAIPVTVVDGSAKPVAGLEVQAFRSWSTGPYKPERVFTTDQQGQVRVPRELTEDDNGIHLIARDTENRLGYITIESRRFSQEQAQQQEKLELRLLPLERTIRGRLVDHNGRPVAGAAVGVRSLWERDPQYRRIDWHGSPSASPIGSATSQDDGAFALRVPQTLGLVVQIAHRDFVAVYKYYRAGEDDLGTVSLRAGATIAGRAIHAETGKPVAGARIFASDQLDDDDEPRTGEIRYGSDYTDADGKYEIASLRPGLYHIVLFGVEDRPRLTAVALERLPIEGGRTTTADFRVIEGRLLAGRVVDIDDGAPINGIQVAVNSPAFPRSSRGGHHHVKTDPAGNFRFYLPPGEARVHINEGQNSRFPESKRSVFLEAETPLEPIVLRGRSREKEQEQNQWRRQTSGSGYATTTYSEETRKAADNAPKPKEITIRFRTSDNKPVGRSVMEIWSRGGGPSMMMAHSGSEFSFQERYVGGFGPQDVPNTGQGKTSYLVIDAHGYARPEPVAVRAGQGQTTITIDLKTPIYVPIRGRIVDGHGSPIAGANVAIWLYTLGRRSDEPWGAQYVTDKQGRFEIKHTYVGNRISLVVTKAGWSGALTEPRLLDESNPIELGDLTMTEPNGVIAGRVVDMNDEPLPGLVVAEQKNKIQTRTDAQGRFRLTSLPVGEASVAVVGSEYESFPRDVAVGTSDMLIRLYPKSPARRTDVPMIRGKFQTADGKPVTAHSSYWWIDIAGEPQLWMTTSRDSDSFEFSNVWQHALAKGKPQRLVIEVAGYKRPEPLEVATNKEIDVVVKLEPASSVPVSGRVLDTDGKPVEGATVWTTLKIWGELESDAWGPPTTTDNEGRFELRHIKDGDDVTIHIGRPGHAGAAQRRTARADSQIELGDVRLSPAKARLSGVVVNRAKKPVAGARVYANYLGKTFETTTDSEGRFELAGLPDGNVLITVEADAFRTHYRGDSNAKAVTIGEYPHY